MSSLVLFLSFLFLLLLLSPPTAGQLLPCASLYPALYCCAPPTLSPLTSQPLNCMPNNTAVVPCFARPNVSCSSAVAPDPRQNATVLCDGAAYSAADRVFSMEIPCVYASPENAYDFQTALSLSVFLGMLGIDRFYLGYPAIGLLKLLTLGFFFVGQLVDVVLIALQLVGPADGSGYAMPFNGPRVTRLTDAHNAARRILDY